MNCHSANNRLQTIDAERVIHGIAAYSRLLKIAVAVAMIRNYTNGFIDIPEAKA